MNNEFERAFDIIIMHEGGYVNDPYDSGGETKYGITKRVARSWGYKGDMTDLSLQTAKKIYKQNYWDSIRIDEFEGENLKVLLFDTAVNMGAVTSIRKLQKAYNILNRWEITVDGIVGPQTIGAVNNYQYIKDLKFWYCIIRGEKYANIVRNNNTQQRFIRGWGRRLMDMINRIDY